MPRAPIAIEHVPGTRLSNRSHWGTGACGCREARGPIRAFGISLNNLERWNGVEAVRLGLVDAVQVIDNVFHCLVGQHRLSRGSERQPNADLHRIAITQLRCPSLGQAYVAKRIASGDNKTEAIRVCLEARPRSAARPDMIDQKRATRALP